MAKRGRPTDYKPEYAEQAGKLAKLGSTDLQIADFFGVCEKTFYVWAKKYPEFIQAIKDGKLEFDRARVEGALIHSALGYSHQSEKIFLNKDGEIVRAPTTEHYPPNPTSLIFWLKNRGQNWRDRQELEHAGKDGTPLIPVINFGKKPNQ